MASIDNTIYTEVAAGALPDSVDVKLRKSPLSVFRTWAPAAGLAQSGTDLGLWNDPVSDEDPLVVAVLVDGVPNGLVRTTDLISGDSVLWAEPSPRSWDEYSPTSQDLSIVAPTGVALDEVALGVGTEVELTTDDRIVPKVVRPVIDLDGAFQGLQATAGQPESTMYAEITETLTEFGQPPVVTGPVDRDIFYGAGGSVSIVLPAVTVHAEEGSTFKVRCDLRLRYRNTVSETFPVSINGLRVGLQIVEYTSL